MLESFFQNPVSAKGLPESLVLQLKGFIKSRMEEGCGSDSTCEITAPYETRTMARTKQALNHQS